MTLWKMAIGFVAALLVFTPSMSAADRDSFLEIRLFVENELLGFRPYDRGDSNNYRGEVAIRGVWQGYPCHVILFIEESHMARVPYAAGFYFSVSSYSSPSNGGGGPQSARGEIYDPSITVDRDSEGRIKELSTSYRMEAVHQIGRTRRWEHMIVNQHFSRNRVHVEEFGQRLFEPETVRPAFREATCEQLDWANARNWGSL